jgi:hypothetical protein
MTPAQRQAAFERLLVSVARRRAESLGVSYVGTIRRMAPPPLPGEAAGTTMYFVNAALANGKGPTLVEFGTAFNAELRRAEKWVETGKGPAPKLPKTKKSGRVTRKV